MKTPEAIEGERIQEVDVNSTWEADLGEGCELCVTLSDGSTLFVIRTGLPSAEEEIDTWREEHAGKRIEDTREITSIALSTGGHQTTLDITLEDDFTFEGDLMQEVDRTDKGTEDLESEWTFEGTPGVEMGEQPREDEDP